MNAYTAPEAEQPLLVEAVVDTSVEQLSSSYAPTASVLFESASLWPNLSELSTFGALTYASKVHVEPLRV